MRSADQLSQPYPLSGVSSGALVGQEDVRLGIGPHPLVLPFFPKGGKPATASLFDV